MVKIFAALIFLVVQANCDSPPRYEQNYLRANFDLLADGDENFRLDDDVTPEHYWIQLTPYIGSQSHFDGIVDITFKAKKAISKIVLNQQNIQVNDAILTNIGAVDDIRVDRYENIDQYEKVECVLNKNLEIGQEYQLHLKYTATVHKDMRGFYESYYYNNDFSKTLLMTTHFGQMTRRLMPCFDEPHLKATFKISVGRNPGIHSSTISNAKLENTEAVNSSWVIDHFKPTMKLSTYLLAIVVSDFDALVDDAENATFRVYVRPNAIDQAEYAFEIGPKIIQELSSWTDFPYYSFEGVEKLDFGAIPDFSAGAMENLGLLLHRETAILVEETYSTAQQFQRVALVMAHELAHMWFGDLVTHRWFDATWLTEGFARYFQNVGVDPVEQDMEVMQQFVVYSLQPAFQADQVPTSHPLTATNIYSYPQVRTLFSSITYDKGGSILRMIHNYMKPGAFQKAIQEYLKIHAYGSAIPPDLFAQLERQDPEFDHLNDIMASYTLQPGFPVVSVKREGDILTLTQSRFFIERQQEGNQHTWAIPISYAINAGDLTVANAHLTVFKRFDLELKLDIAGGDLDFYLINVDSIGFYRVDYDNDNWNAIGRALKSTDFGKIGRLNRAEIIDDLFNLARAGYLRYDFILPIVDYVRGESDYIPWRAFLNGMAFLQQRKPNEQYQKNFDGFLKNMLEVIYGQLGSSTNGTHLTRMNRNDILTWACKYEVGDCVEKATQRFEQVLRNENIAADWRPAVYCTGLRVMENEWDNFWERFVHSNYATDAANILTALGCTKNKGNLEKFLSKILTEDVRPQDKSAAYSSAYTGNLENIDIVFDYVTGNWEKWSEVMDLGSTLADLANRFYNEEQLNKLEGFMSDNKAKLPESVFTRLEQAVVRSQKNLQFDQDRLIDEMSYFSSSANLVVINFSLITTLAIILRFLF